MKKKLFFTALIILSLLATIKMFFFGLNIDEEYAVTMSFRMVTGDRMFLDMWEPHQTSGFISALLIRIFIAVTGGTEYLILYLRACGAIIQAGISIFLYRTAKQYFSPDASFIAAIFFYNTLPKWIQVPEFANGLIWFSTLAFLCFLHYYNASHQHKRWLIGGGVCLSGLVLCYPSCILAVPVIFVGMWVLNRKTFIKDAGIVLITCLVLATLYIGYFLSNMSFSEFLYGLQQMMTDGSHSASLWERLAAYGNELIRLLPHVVLIMLISALLLFILRNVFSNILSISGKLTFTLVFICVALAEQVIIWLSGSVYLHYPLIYFYIIYFIGVSFYIGFSRKSSNTINFKIKVLIWMGSIWGGAVWLTALLITNTTLSVTGSYLMTGLISTILLLGELLHDEREKYSSAPLRALVFFTSLCLLGATLFVKGYMVCENEGRKATMLYVKQKALSGPAKNIYCRYSDGYSYNNFAALTTKYLQDGDCVLYVGEHSLYYLLGNHKISTYSTISTPTFDERLLDYWEQYPERYPDVVVCDTKGKELEQVKKILPLGKAIVEKEGIQIYYIK